MYCVVRGTQTPTVLAEAADVLSDQLRNQLIRLAELTAPKVAAVAPSAETARLVEASKEVVERELLETYLEEAGEVLATVRQHLDIMRRRPHDHEALVTIRRGFHTLKGSGRMVESARPTFVSRGRRGGWRDRSVVISRPAVDVR